MRQRHGNGLIVEASADGFLWSHLRWALLSVYRNIVLRITTPVWRLILYVYHSMYRVLNHYNDRLTNGTGRMMMAVIRRLLSYIDQRLLHPCEAIGNAIDDYCDTIMMRMVTWITPIMRHITRPMIIMGRWIITQWYQRVWTHRYYVYNRVIKPLLIRCAMYLSRAGNVASWYNGISAYMTSTLQPAITPVLRRYIYTPMVTHMNHMLRWAINQWYQRAWAHRYYVYNHAIKPLLVRAAMYLTRAGNVMASWYNGISYMTSTIRLAITRVLQRYIYTPMVTCMNHVTNGVHRVCTWCHHHIWRRIVTIVTMVCNRVTTAILRVMRFVSPYYQRMIVLPCTTLYYRVTIMISPYIIRLWTIISTHVRVMIMFVSQLPSRIRLRLRKGFTNSDYTVYIPQGRALTTSRGHHVLLHDGTPYVVQLRNDNAWSCNCYLTIDDIAMGTFRLQPRSIYTIERPAGAQKCFIFRAENSSIPIGSMDTSTGIVTGASCNGILAARFVPVVMPSMAMLRMQQLQRQRQSQANGHGTRLPKPRTRAERVARAIAAGRGLRGRPLNTSAVPSSSSSSSSSSRIMEESDSKRSHGGEDHYEDHSYDIAEDNDDNGGEHMAPSVLMVKRKRGHHETSHETLSMTNDDTEHRLHQRASSSLAASSSSAAAPPPNDTAIVAEEIPEWLAHESKEEKKDDHDHDSPDNDTTTATPDEGKELKAGATTLGGVSNQRYAMALHGNEDASRSIIITIRLVIDDNRVIAHQPANHITQPPVTIPSSSSPSAISSSSTTTTTTTASSSNAVSPSSSSSSNISADSPTDLVASLSSSPPTLTLLPVAPLPPPPPPLMLPDDDLVRMMASYGYTTQTTAPAQELQVDERDTTRVTHTGHIV